MLLLEFFTVADDDVDSADDDDDDVEALWLTLAAMVGLTFTALLQSLVLVLLS